MRNRVNQIKEYRRETLMMGINVIKRANLALYNSRRSFEISACRCLIMGLRYVMRRI